MLVNRMCRWLPYRVGALWVDLRYGIGCAVIPLQEFSPTQRRRDLFLIMLEFWRAKIRKIAFPSGIADFNLVRIGAHSNGKACELCQNSIPHESAYTH